MAAHPAALARVEDYLEAAGHREDTTGALFGPVRNNRSAGKLGGTLTADGVYRAVVCRYAREAGINGLEGFGPHALRATAATNALDHEADMPRSRSGWGTWKFRRHAYRYRFIRKLSGQGATEATASAALRKTWDRTLGHFVYPQPCPHCGVLQPGMMAQERIADRARRVPPQRT